MALYIIEKWHGGTKKVNPKSTDKYDWVLAFGLKGGRSYIEVDDDVKAVEKFKLETAKSKKPFFRLMRFGGGGYGSNLALVGTANC